MSDAKVVITGGAGFIGSQLSRMLTGLGYRVLLLDDLSFGYRDNLLFDGKPVGEFVHCDIRNDPLEKHFEDAACVFHLAAISALPVCQSEPARAIDVNVRGTASVLEAARLTGVRRVVFASTSAVYENSKSFPCHEDDPVSPNLIYAQTKLAAERLCLSYTELYGLPVAITRYYNVYGPNQDVRRKSPPFVAYVIRELLNRRRPVLHSAGRQERDYVFIDDVNRLNLLCMREPAGTGQIFNVASGRSHSVNHIYRVIAALLESDLEPVFRPGQQFWADYPVLARGPYSLDEQRVATEVDKFTLGSTAKAAEILGWRVETPLEAGLEATVEHAKRVLGR